MINFSDYCQMEISKDMWTFAEKIAKRRHCFGLEYQSSKILNLGDKFRNEVVGAAGELAIRSLLIGYYREFTYNLTGYKSDEGIDFVVNGGTINVKCSEYYPQPNLRLMTRMDIKHDADYFAQCFIQENTCYFVGMETNERLIKDENITTIKSVKYGGEFKAYALPISQMSIKSASLLENPLTVHDGRVFAMSFLSCLNWGLDKV